MKMHQHSAGIIEKKKASFFKSCSYICTGCHGYLFIYKDPFIFVIHWIHLKLLTE